MAEHIPHKLDNHDTEHLEQPAMYNIAEKQLNNESKPTQYRVILNSCQCFRYL
jgi:hypothetical protein